MKKIISVFLSLIMVLSITSGLDVSAFATELTSGSCGDNVTYEYDSSTGTLTISGTGNMESFAAIAGSPFYNNENIKNVIIEDGITSIGQYAFYNCSEITDVAIPNTIKSIGQYSFYSCIKLKSVSIPDGAKNIDEKAFYNCQAIKTITIPGSVTTIGKYAFQSCSNLTNVTICEGVTTIGYEAFHYCSKLKNITLPNSLTSLGSSVFEYCSQLMHVSIGNKLTLIDSFTFGYCSALSDITIPKSVTKIEQDAFTSCNSLTDVYYSGTKAEWNNITIVLGSSQGNNTIKNASIHCRDSQGSFYTYKVLENRTAEITGFYGNDTELTIPSTIDGYSVTSIGGYVFKEYSNITSIIIPEGVTTIGDAAFSRCSNLSNISIPNSVTSIGNWAFDYCHALENIKIPEGVTTIGDSAFFDCTGLETITIPNSVTSIGDLAFNSCSGLTKIVIRNTNVNIVQSSTNDENETLHKGATILSCPGSTAETYAETYNRKFVIDHVWDEGVENSAETITYTCSICGATRTKSIDEITHNNYGSNSVSASDLEKGDTFEMGKYPQAKVTDAELLAALDDVECNPTSYNYLINSKEQEHTYDTVSMSYADISYNGELYRKVIIDSYRNDNTGQTTNAKHRQEENGYLIGNTYYFKWEPIVWQVLAKEDDGVYVMSKLLLDSQEYNHYYEDVTWEECSLRNWLNNDFYNIAFSESEKDNINSITLQNENSPHFENDGGNDTTDKLWLLSYSDITNTDYGFLSNYLETDVNRGAQSSDYAKSQGLWYDSENLRSTWWLRTPGKIYYNYSVFNECYIQGDNDFVNDTDNGVRPAYKLDLNAVINSSGSASCDENGHTYEAVVTAPTCTEQGYTTYTCSKCGDSYKTDFTNATGHSWNDGEITTEPTYTTEGIKTYTCTVCHDTYSEAVPKLKGHISVDTDSFENGTVTVEPTDATVGDEITVTATPDEGYHTESIAVTDNEGQNVPVDENGTFEMPAGNVTVDVVFAINVYTVTYLDANGNEIATEQVEHGKKAINVPAIGISYNGNSTHTTTAWAEDVTTAITADTVFNQTASVTDCSFESEVTKEATCVLKGERTYTCTVCSGTKTEEIQIDANNHKNVATDSRVEPKCTETGLTEGTHCADCNSVIIAQQTIPATGHSYVSEVTAPTCTEQGYTTYTCSACRNSYITDYTNATGHSWNDGEITTQPTYTADGVKTFTCTVCSDTYTESVPKLKGHINIDADSFENGTVTVEPTDATVGDEITITATPDEGYHTESITVTDNEGQNVPVDENGTFEMPAGNATINVVFTINTYLVKYLDSFGEIISTEKVNHGETTKAVPSTGVTCNYDNTHTTTSWAEDVTTTITNDTVFHQLSQTDDCAYECTETIEPTYSTEGRKTFTCPLCRGAYFEAVPKLKGHITVDTDSIENGTVTVEPTDATVGDEITVTATPDEGYHTESITVTDNEGQNVPVDENGTFEMPAGNVTVDVVFAINVYTVKYLDTNSNVISTEQVEHGKKAVNVPATGISYNGNSTHTTTSWDKDVTAVIMADTVFNKVADTENCTYEVTSQTDCSVKSPGTVEYTCSKCGSSYSENGTYTDVESHWNFENKAASISRSYYTNLYGAQMGPRIYDYDRERGNNGTCFGFPYSSGMFKVGSYSTSTLFNESTLYDVSKTQGIINRSNSYFKHTNNAYDVVLYSHLYQFSYDISKQISEHYNNVDTLIQKCIASQNGGTPISILLKSSYGAHAVLCERVFDLGNNNYKIKVYDANYPSANNFLYITKESNRYTWRMYFCDYYGRELYFTGDSNNISYLEIDDKLLDILKSGKTVSAFEVSGNDNYGDDKYIIGANSTSSFGCSVELIEVTESFNALVDTAGESTESTNNSKLYWADMADNNAPLVITSQNGLNDFSITGNSTSASINSDGNSKVSFETNKSEISKVKVEDGNNTGITFEQSENGTDVSYSIDGNTNGDVEINNNASGITVKGCEDGTTLSISVEKPNANGETETVTAQAVISDEPLKVEVLNGEAISLAYDTDNSGEYNNKLEDVNLVTNNHEHNWVEGRVIKTATCTEKGEKVCTCSECKSSKIKYTDLLAHDYHPTVTKATCTSGGYTTYTCSNCHKSYVSNKTDSLGHTYAIKTEKATASKNGKIVNYCTRCNKIVSTNILYKASNIKADKLSFTYNGGVKKPVITVEDSSGNALSTKNYAITWENSSSANVGKYKVSVNLKGDYNGRKDFVYTINPKGTALTKVTSPEKKKLKIVWKKQSKQTTGYQIQYSLNSNFKDAKTVTVNSNKKSKTIIKNLKSKKKYYVRIRTFKKAGKTKYYSTWSKTNKVKTK